MSEQRMRCKTGIVEVFSKFWYVDPITPDRVTYSSEILFVPTSDKNKA
jgi:hypothetical protein